MTAGGFGFRVCTPGRLGGEEHMGVLSLVAKRLGLGFVTLFVVSIIIFGAVELLPGDLA